MDIEIDEEGDIVASCAADPKKIFETLVKRPQDQEDFTSNKRKRLQY